MQCYTLACGNEDIQNSVYLCCLYIFQTLLFRLKLSVAHRCHILYGNLIKGWGKIQWVKRGKNFQPSQGKRLVGCWAGSTSSPPALTQHHQPGLSFALLHGGSLVQGHPPAPMAALESLVSDTVFPECLKVGLNLACSNFLAFDIDKPRLITECLIRDCI